MEQLKAYKFRIYPTEEQEIFFAKSLVVSVRSTI
ncbi:helix-turn-helix domain-containing protein [Enterococcus faecium]